MAIRSIAVSLKGIGPLLQANPQTVDRFNKYAKEMARITAKGKKRTDEDYKDFSDIEVRSRVHWSDEVGVYVPSTWLTSSIHKHSFEQAKVAKDKVRGSVFSTEEKIKLAYKNSDLVKTVDDIVGNSIFRHKMNLKQGQIRVIKTSPIFHDWSFSTVLEFDDKILDHETLDRIIKHAAFYGGFGDFRPTFGRAIAEVSHV